MSMLIVSYSLKGPATSYVQFYETLRAQGTWWHYLPATWLLYTTRRPEQIANALRPCMQKGDHIFVGTLQNGYNGWLPKGAWDWIKAKGLSSNPDE